MSGFNYHAFETPPPEWDEQEAAERAAELDQEENDG